MRGMVIGERVRNFRIERGLTQSDLGQLTAIPSTAISRIECGSRTVYLDDAVQLAKALKVSLDELAGVAQEVARRDELEELKASMVHYLDDLKNRVQTNDFAGASA